MNDNMSSIRYAVPQSKLFLKAVLLAGVAAGLGFGLGDAKAVTDVAASAPTTNTAAHRTERVMSDSWITTKVKSEILESSLAKGFDVKVITLHGVVTLRGTLASAEAIEQVKEVAMKVKGVQSVDASPLVVSSK